MIFLSFLYFFMCLADMSVFRHPEFNIFSLSSRCFSIAFLEECIRNFMATCVSGSAVSLSSNLPMGGQGSSDGGVRALCHEVSRGALPLNSDLRFDHRLWHG